MTTKLSSLLTAMVTAALVLMATAAPTAAPQRGPDWGNYDWPTKTPAPVVRDFAPPPEKWLAGHRGVDLGYTVDAPIYAPYDGVVAFSGDVAQVTVISVDHPDGVRTTYQPVSDPLPAGSVVKRRQVIAYLDRGHDANTLHWGARIAKDVYINPLRLIYGTIRLKPES